MQQEKPETQCVYDKNGLPLRQILEASFRMYLLRNPEKRKP